MLYLVNKWVSDLVRANFIHPVFEGYYNGKYGSYTKSPGFYSRIQFEKGDLDIYIDYDEDNASDLFKVTILNDTESKQLKWANSTPLCKLKELLEMMKQPTAVLVKYINDQESLVSL
ncbi:hypothetical protein [Paenibacillus sp. EPM92]|uniref:hypothetical protein n=1 Tax=Paenibacillus sp. EPM92 TaxID=1561195 RepID=UPI001915D2DE|nr:hypothetical protein [Paenibacillus sp. EPM92]